MKKCLFLWFILSFQINAMEEPSQHVPDVNFRQNSLSACDMDFSDDEYLSAQEGELVPDTKVSDYKDFSSKKRIRRKVLHHYKKNVAFQGEVPSSLHTPQDSDSSDTERYDNRHNSGDKRKTKEKKVDYVVRGSQGKNTPFLVTIGDKVPLQISSEQVFCSFFHNGKHLKSSVSAIEKIAMAFNGKIPREILDDVQGALVGHSRKLNENTIDLCRKNGLMKDDSTESTDLFKLLHRFAYSGHMYYGRVIKWGQFSMAKDSQGNIHSITLFPYEGSQSEPRLLGSPLPAL